MRWYPCTISRLVHAAATAAVAVMAAFVFTPAAKAARSIPVGMANVNNQPMNSRGYVYAIRFVLDRNTRVYRFFSGFNLEGASGYPEAGARSGYGLGSGGIINARLVTIGKGGQPNLRKVLAQETVSAVSRYGETKRAYYINGRNGMLFFNTRGVLLRAGRMYAMTYRNVDPRPAQNWFSENSPVVKESAAGPNGRNNLNPNAAGAIAGLDSREAVAWSTNGGRSWVWGRQVGGGPTRFAYSGSPRDDNGTRLPWFGWQSSPRARPQSTQPYYAYSKNGNFALQVRAPRATLLTDAGGYAPSGASVGVVTVRNLRTGQAGSTAPLGSGIQRGPLSPAIAVNAGDTYEITHTGAVFVQENDEFIQAIFGVGNNPAIQTVGRRPGDLAELFALPHPLFAPSAR